MADDVPLADMTDEDLEALRAGIQGEQARRYQAEAIPLQVGDLIRSALESGVDRDRIDAAIANGLGIGTPPTYLASY